MCAAFCSSFRSFTDLPLRSVLRSVCVVPALSPGRPSLPCPLRHGPARRLSVLLLCSVVRCILRSCCLWRAHFALPFCYLLRLCAAASLGLRLACVASCAPPALPLRSRRPVELLSLGALLAPPAAHFMRRLLSTPFVSIRGLLLLQVAQSGESLGSRSLSGLFWRMRGVLWNFAAR